MARDVAPWVGGPAVTSVQMGSPVEDISHLLSDLGGVYGAIVAVLRRDEPLAFGVLGAVRLEAHRLVPLELLTPTSSRRPGSRACRGAPRRR